MADKSITGLTAAGAITGAELIKIVQGGNSRKVDLDAVIAALAPVGIDGVDGRTVLNGTVVPTTEGVDGDFYIRTTNYVIYGPKTGGAWGSGVSLVGPPGADGADGADGLDGTDGASFLSGSAPPDDVLDGNDGDMYLDYTAYDIYGPKTAGAWGSGTSILGTIGSDGKTILNGVVDPTTEGTDGDFYINTASNFIFGPKAAGTWPSGVSLVGAPGADGLDGVDGVDGRTILYGAVAPTTEGEDGDFYIDTATDMIYGPKAAGTWPAGTSLIGPPGADGLDGTDGTDGVDGKTILNGSGAPSGGTGANGDFYLDTTNYDIYGPKSGGVWGSGTSLRLIPAIHTKTANYVLVLSDANDYIRMNLASANTLTVPTDASVSFPVGTIIHARQVGAGQTTIVASGGVTINTAETLLLRTQGSSVTLIKVATDEWDLTGDLELV